MTIKSILAVVAIIAVVSIITTSVKSISALDHSSSNTTTSAIKVQAGGGNATAPLTVFVPQNIEIKAGLSVTWDNPTTVGEPHTVTFVLDNNTMTNIVSPFAVPNSTEFAAIPPNSNNEPLKVPGKNNVIIGVNARSFVPTVIDSQGSVKQLHHQMQLIL